MKFFKDWLLIPLLFLAAYIGFKWYRSPNFGNGAAAPDFSAMLPSGDSIRLSDFKGKIVLLKFWGSWCGPCRESSEALRNVHNSYKSAQFANASGFQTIIVGIETDKSRWLRALEKDSLLWATNVSSIKRFQEPAALLYGVKEIPTSFLIDENGLIIGVSPSETKIKDLLDRRLQR